MRPACHAGWWCLDSSVLKMTTSNGTTAVLESTDSNGLGVATTHAAGCLTNGQTLLMLRLHCHVREKAPPTGNPAPHSPGPGLRSITPIVLGSDSCTITTRSSLSGSEWIMLETEDMGGGKMPRCKSVRVLPQHVSIRFFSIANSSWRGASRRPNGTGVKCTPGVRRGAGQPCVQADGRRLQSHASVRLVSCAAA